MTTVEFFPVHPELWVEPLHWKPQTRPKKQQPNFTFRCRGTLLCWHLPYLNLLSFIPFLPLLVYLSLLSFLPSCFTVTLLHWLLPIYLIDLLFLSLHTTLLPLVLCFPSLPPSFTAFSQYIKTPPSLSFPPYNRASFTCFLPFSSSLYLLRLFPLHCSLSEY